MPTKTKPRTNKRFADGAIAPKKRRTKPGQKISLKAHPGEDGAPSPGEIAYNRAIIWQHINQERARRGLAPVEPYDV
jgi:hypothetical protein